MIKGLAYGALTSLNPVHGLYASFYPGLFYALFATSKHLSNGTFAIISIMVLSTITKLENQYLEKELQLSSNSSIISELENANQTISTDDIAMVVKLKIATSLAFWCGIVQVLH